MTVRVTATGAEMVDEVLKKVVEASGDPRKGGAAFKDKETDQTCVVNVSYSLEEALKRKGSSGDAGCGAGGDDGVVAAGGVGAVVEESTAVAADALGRSDAKR